MNSHIFGVNWLSDGRYLRYTIAAKKPATELCIGEIFDAVYKGRVHRLKVEKLVKTSSLDIYVINAY